MATIHASTSAVAQCLVCGIQRQFHSKSDVLHSADRDHAFVVMTLDDFEPGDLDVEQLVYSISRLPDGERLVECRKVLRLLVAKKLGVAWEDLMGVLQ